MNSLFRRRFASVALILGFFLAWELLCLAFGVKDIVQVEVAFSVTR